MVANEAGDLHNWVDPDIIAYYEDGGELPDFDPELELNFKEFFDTGWGDPKYDHLRERWDRHIYSDDPYTRVMGKTALWSLVKLFEIRESAKIASSINEPYLTKRKGA